MAKLSDGDKQDKLDAELEAQAEALVKRNGFASLTEFDEVLMNISMIMSGIDQQTKRFIERSRSRTQSPFSSRTTSGWS
jgi:nicotinate-nucleotide pyrophosphorylase